MLTAHIRRDIQSKLHFPKGESHFMNFGNDCPNVSIVVRAAEHALNSYKDLDFVLPPGISQADQIPETWIYVDNINTGTDIVDYLSNELEKRTRENPQASLPTSVIRPFNATLSSEYRTAAMAAFREGTIWIMIVEQ
ncbi:hypothetical protein C8Q72DRAFT_882505 [Fomitopsis betulina]|nr:hypothetical protein C8Q72DRAFT_891337 [Fomitopsis betulina]KAI0732446.1 hypothetical protein C8Q72DRAFT_882505 [Fomitopsis betulina]